MTRAVGCDLSRYNVSFDPAKATEPIDFAFQKATQGALYVDLLYEYIWQGVKQIPVRGAYHYQTGASWLAQADHFLATAERHDYHIHALDLEQYGNIYNDTFFADAKRIIDRWRAVSDKKVVIYTNGSTYDQFYLSLLKLYGEAGASWLDAIPLWIASPTIAGLPILPKYRTNKDWLIHQYNWKGLPSRWGTGGTAVDENVFCGDMNTFASYFGLGSVILPPVVIPPGEQMKGIVKTGYTLNVRDASNAIIGSLKVNDTVYGDVTNNRIYYARIYRANGTIENTAPCSSAVSDGAGVFWMTLTASPAPAPVEITLTHTVEVYSDGSLKVDGISFE
jgi:GH25 family lysozyme M1 (1,4-beta-N-acetylmuramidase)